MFVDGRPAAIYALFAFGVAALLAWLLVPVAERLAWRIGTSEFVRCVGDLVPGVVHGCGFQLTVGATVGRERRLLGVGQAAPHATKGASVAPALGFWPAKVTVIAPEVSESVPESLVNCTYASVIVAPRGIRTFGNRTPDICCPVVGLSE